MPNYRFLMPVAIVAMAASLAACSDAPSDMAAAPAAAPSIPVTLDEPAPAVDPRFAKPHPSLDLAVPLSAFTTMDALMPTNTYPGGDRMWAYALSGSNARDNDLEFFASAVDLTVASSTGNAFERQDRITALAVQGRALVAKLREPASRYVRFTVSVAGYDYDIASQRYVIRQQSRFLDGKGPIELTTSHARFKLYFHGFDPESFEVPTDRARVMEENRDPNTLNVLDVYAYLHTGEPEGDGGVVHGDVVAIGFTRKFGAAADLTPDDMAIRTIR